MSEVKQERLQNRLGPEIAEFRQTCRTLQLATVDADGQPNVSYAPYALGGKAYYILISELARHTQNLLEQPVLSLMMIEDEVNSKQMFARKRLTFDASVMQVSRDTEEWSQGIDALHRRFGEIVSGLSSLADFHLFRLTPVKGLFVKGFGQAFEVSGDDMVDVVHLKEGHRRIGQ
ncbi:heme utilization protein HutZ [Parasalinivibrio latis]|uniref:heme utilization protein HutZ n=1 Tax=Parasalinivibrio latis TaxID=2952610 RepID=UPI0030DF999A